MIPLNLIVVLILLQVSTVYLILKTIKNATDAIVAFLINISVIHFAYVIASLPFVRSCLSLSEGTGLCP